jgi:integrase
MECSHYCSHYQVIFMASVFRRENSPNWYAAYRGADNRRVKVSTKLTDRKEARAFASKLEKAATLGRAGLLTEAVARKLIAESYEIAASRSMTFSSAKDWLNNWLEEKRNTRRAGTVNRYKPAIEAMIGSLGSRAKLDIKHIDVRDAENLRRELIATGKRNRSINEDCKALSAAFNHALRLGFIDRNPFNGLEKLEETPSCKKNFTHEQVKAILSFCDNEWRGLCLVAYYTGMRVSDATGLKWSSLRLDEDFPAIRYSEIKKQNKHKREIVVPIHMKLLEYFMSLKKGKGDDCVFPTLAKHSTGGNKGLSQSFRRIMIQAGIVEKLHGKKKEGSVARNVSPYGMHSFRHTFKTELANRDVAKDVRDALTGHAKPDVAEGYVHRDFSVLVDAVSKLPEIAA